MNNKNEWLNQQIDQALADNETFQVFFNDSLNHIQETLQEIKEYLNQQEYHKQ